MIKLTEEELWARSIYDLRALAKERGIQDFSGLKRPDLIRALRENQDGKADPMGMAMLNFTNALQKLVHEIVVEELSNVVKGVMLEDKPGQ